MDSGYLKSNRYLKCIWLLGISGLSLAKFIRGGGAGRSSGVLMHWRRICRQGQNIKEKVFQKCKDNSASPHSGGRGMGSRVARQLAVHSRTYCNSQHWGCSSVGQYFFSRYKTRDLTSNMGLHGGVQISVWTIGKSFIGSDQKIFVWKQSCL